MSAPGRPSSSSVRCSRGGGNAVAERRSRGAPLGDALAEVARRTGMSEADALDRVLARSAWKSTVAVRIGAGTSRLKWSKTPLPALDNLGGLRHATAFNAVDRARFFLDDSAPTALERADGNWGPALRRLGSHHASAGATVAALAAAFDKHLAPACRQPRTRADYWRAWRLVVTWAVARQASRARRPSWCGSPSRRVTGSFSSASRSARLTSTRRGSSCWARSAVGRWHSSCRSRRLRCGGCSHGGPRRWRRTGRAC
jgi:hypothetical protein